MPYNLTLLAHQKGIKRNITLRPIVPTKAQAQDLYAIYAPIIALWQAAVPKIMAGYEKRPLVDGMTLDTADDMQREIDAAASEMSRIVVMLTPRLQQWALRFEKWHRNKWVGAIYTATNIDMAMMLTTQPVQETIGSFIARNVALMKDISAQTQGRISDIVFREYQNRTPAREVAKQLNEAVGLGKKRALRVAADQSQKLSAGLDLERHAEAGIEQYRWRHSGKAHPRIEHKARDGKLYDLNKPEGDQPGYAPYCGCKAQAYLPILDEFGL